MITWPSRHLRQAHLIYVSRTAPKTGRPAISEKNFAKGYIVKDEHKNESAQDTRWLAFNIQRPVFSDRRVREAITPGV